MKTEKQLTGLLSLLIKEIDRVDDNPMRSSLALYREELIMKTDFILWMLRDDDEPDFANVEKKW